MIVPDTPLNELPDDATAAQMIAKVNEIIRAINDMWNPADGSDA
jgi:hypothetical protein